MNMPVLLLTTTGRQSRRARTTALSYLGDGDRYVVIASNAGESRHPGWFLNLKADPRAHVQVGPHRLPVTAWETAGDERERLWSRVAEADRSYAEYQRRTRRRIPIVILQPEHGTAPRLPVRAAKGSRSPAEPVAKEWTR
jgi:deazaflavin-dependent oxidoreductase (nitroreductase family)